MYHVFSVSVISCSREKQARQAKGEVLDDARRERPGGRGGGGGGGVEGGGGRGGGRGEGGGGGGGPFGTSGRSWSWSCRKCKKIK